MTPSAATRSVQPGFPGVADRIRQRRERARLTLDQTATAAGLSKGYLSRVERGHRQPSLAALLAIAGALGTTVAGLLDHAPAGQADALTNDGLLVEALQHEATGPLQAFRLTVPARRPAGDLVAHPGSECMYVLSGTLQLEVGGETYLLTANDSLTFDTERPHRVSAVGDDDAIVLLVATSAR
jgi:transcriptional regulator with XRE-family HTH domain